MSFGSLARYGKHLRPKSVFSGVKTYHYIRELRRNQWRSEEELREIQWKRLTTIVRHAYDHVPFYRREYDRAGFHPRDLKNLDDIRNIPTIGKEEIRENPTDFMSEGFDPSRHEPTFTSGSTGMPLKIVKDDDANARGLALKAYAFSECGVRWNDRFVTVAQSPGAALPNHIIVAPRAKTTDVLEDLRKARLDILYSYASFLTVIGQYDVTGIEPRLIFSQGMNLTDFSRDVVRKTFGLEVHDTYGSVEFSRLAFECGEHSGLHLITDWAVVEFLKEGEPAKPGETGEIVVTGLHNYAQPLIRYRIDDYGAMSSERCPCGRSWPLIERIDGRGIDFLLLPSGKRINPSMIYFSVHSEAEQNVYSIAQFQAVQDRRDHLILKIVKGMEFDPEMVERVRAKTEQGFTNVGEKVSVDLEFVDSIEQGRTGKSKIVVCLTD